MPVFLKYFNDICRCIKCMSVRYDFLLRAVETVIQRLVIIITTKHVIYVYCGVYNSSCHVLLTYMLFVIFL